MYRILNTRKLILILVGCLTFSLSSHVFAAERFRVSAQIFHLGELIGTPVMDVEEGETSAGAYSVEGAHQYKFAILVRPVADGQVYVSMQFASGNLDIQPNLLVDIGTTTSATIKKVSLNLLVERIEDTPLKTHDSPAESLTQSAFNHAARQL